MVPAQVVAGRIPVLPDAGSKWFNGLGRTMAQAVFDALPGAWEVGQMTLNAPAQAFWRDVIGQYTAGDFVEQELRGSWWEGQVQCFESKPRA